MDPDLLLTITTILAAARLTRLATADTIAERARVWIVDRAARHSDARAVWWDQLLMCPWCAGWWISCATVAFVWAVPDDIATLLLAPWALSYLVGTLEQHN